MQKECANVGYVKKMKKACQTFFHENKLITIFSFVLIGYLKKMN